MTQSSPSLEATDVVEPEPRLLPKATKLFEMIAELEKKQEESRAKMMELKRSLFHKMAKELDADGIGPRDPARFALFWQYAKLVLGKAKVCCHDMTHQEAWEITGSGSEQEQLNWFRHWADLGVLKREMHWSPAPCVGKKADPLWYLASEAKHD